MNRARFIGPMERPKGSKGALGGMRDILLRFFELSLLVVVGTALTIFASLARLLGLDLNGSASAREDEEEIGRVQGGGTSDDS